MDQEAIDSLVLQKLLSLARELRIVLPVAADNDFSSLHAMRCIHAHLLLQRDSTIAACAGTTNACSSKVDQPPERAFASTSTGGWRSNNYRPREDMHHQERTTPRSGGSSVVC
ncbi:unnamed protein product [Lampetra planeri]